MVHCAVHRAAAVLSPALGSRLRPWPQWTALSPQLASRWVPLMSPSHSSSVGLFFPEPKGSIKGGRGGPLAGSATGRGWGQAKKEKDNWEIWISHFFINNQCGKTECDGCVREKVVPHGALWRSPLCALWSVFIVIDCTVVHLFLC